MRKVGIVQPNYLPWRGFFHLIQRVDAFVFLDDVQYTTGDWRNRNRIKRRDGGSLWLTVPTLGGQDQLIRDVRIDRSQPWMRKHLSALRHNYGGTDFFERYIDRLTDAYSAAHERLSDLDITLTKLLCEIVGLEREFHVASTLGCSGTKDEKLIGLVKALGGDLFLSGPAARSYIRPELWSAAGIALEYMVYPSYPEYAQISAPFEGAVSVLDLLFMKGPDAPNYIWNA